MGTEYIHTHGMTFFILRISFFRLLRGRFPEGPCSRGWPGFAELSVTGRYRDVAAISFNPLTLANEDDKKAKQR